MRNKDAIKAGFRQAFADAMQSNDTNAVVEAFVNYAEQIGADIKADAEAYRQTQDASILARRGVRVLTSEEKAWYSKAIKAMQSADVRSAVTGLTEGIPTTIIEDVLENIKKDFPLVNAVDCMNTGAMAKILVNAQGRQKAVWGALNSAITKELSGAVAPLDISHNKLSAYIPVSQDMLLEGPEWVDAYVRALLVEALGEGLCDGIINGNGKDQPIGMKKNLSVAVDPVTGYADKTAVTLTSLKPAAYGAVVATLATDGTGRARKIDSLIMVCNPVDYFGKVAPATCYLTEVGTYVHNVLPYPTEIIQDANVTQGTAIIGVGKAYKLGVGVGGDGGRIEYSDQYQFVEDNRVYKIKAYANGRPTDNKAFVVADISGLEPLQS